MIPLEKRRIDNGPWVGGVYATANWMIMKSVTDIAWNKWRDIVMRLVEELKGNPDKLLSFKRLEQDRWFLYHMAMTYDQILPFLKGFHLTLWSHTRQRNEGGMKIKELEWIDQIESAYE